MRDALHPHTSLFLDETRFWREDQPWTHHSPGFLRFHATHCRKHAFNKCPSTHYRLDTYDHYNMMIFQFEIKQKLKFSYQ